MEITETVFWKWSNIKRCICLGLHLYPPSVVTLLWMTPWIEWCDFSLKRKTHTCWGPVIHVLHKFHLKHFTQNLTDVWSLNIIQTHNCWAMRFHRTLHQVTQSRCHSNAHTDTQRLYRSLIWPWKGHFNVLWSVASIHSPPPSWKQLDRRLFIKSRALQGPKRKEEPSLSPFLLGANSFPKLPPALVFPFLTVSTKHHWDSLWKTGFNNPSLNLTKLWQSWCF